MNRIVRGIIAAIVLCATSIAAHAATPVKTNGQLRVEGTQLVNSKGQPVQLRGVSFGWHCLWPQFYNTSAVDYLAKKWNVDIVRCSIGLDLEDQSFEKQPAMAYEKVDQIVKGAVKNGIYVIIDFHSHANNLALAKDFFANVTKKYGHLPNVIFEIWNEPTEIEWSEAKSYAEQLIPLIRENAPQSIIFVPTPRWDQEVNLAADDPLTGFDNIMYSLHFYAATHKDDLRAKAEYAISKGLPLFMSECASMLATGDGIVDFDSWQQWMDLANRHNISWIVWSLSDKVETCSMLRPGTTPDATKWTDNDLKPWAIVARHYINRDR